MNTWVLGDVHGQYSALKQVLERSRFDYKKDRLIFLGDVVDRGGHPFECIRELMLIRSKVLVRGNHDDNLHTYIKTGVDGFNGKNGVLPTLSKWAKLDEEVKEIVREFFNCQVPYFIDEDQRLFVHAGFLPTRNITAQTEDFFLWDRDLWEEAVKRGSERIPTKDNFLEIYIGHTPTLKYHTPSPMLKGGIWNMDTGTGFEGGRLTLMNVKTKDYVQSDPVCL